MQIWQFLTLELWMQTFLDGGAQRLAADAHSRAAGGHGMKQVLQHARTGEIAVAEVPAPQLLPGCVLVRIAASLVSAGTERASSEFASKNLLQKAKARPDLVREVLGKIRRDGILSAVAAVRSRLDQPTRLGYSSAGTVVGVGEGVTDSQGLAIAWRARAQDMPSTPNSPVFRACWCAKIPVGRRNSEAFEEAAFTTVGAVALHGIRMAEVKLGDMVAVIGLGLLGQLTVQDAESRRLPCAWAWISFPSARNLRSAYGRDGVATRRLNFAICVSQHSARTRRGCGVDHGRNSEQRSRESCGSRSRAIAPSSSRWAPSAWTSSARLTTRRNSISAFRVPMVPAATMPRTSRRAGIIPSAMCAGPKLATWKHFCSCSREGSSDLKSLITHRFPIDRAHGAYELITGKIARAHLWEC